MHRCRIANSEQDKFCIQLLQKTCIVLDVISYNARNKFHIKLGKRKSPGESAFWYADRKGISVEISIRLTSSNPNEKTTNIV